MTFLDLGDMMIPYIQVLAFLWGEANNCTAGAQEQSTGPKKHGQVLELYKKLQHHQEWRARCIWKSCVKR